MNKFPIAFFVTLTTLMLRGQGVENPENFKEGMILKFLECLADSIHPGPAGKNRVWDYSKIKHKTTSLLTEEIVKTEQTPYKKEFKNSDFAEKNSDGTLFFFNLTENENHLVGFADEKSKFSIHYSDLMVFMKRSIHLGDSISDTFKRNYNINGMDMADSGTIHIVADGSGTLILPNWKHENVLRIKIEIIQFDSPVQYTAWPSKSVQKTRVWFDDKHTSALLKIDRTESPYYNEKSIKYLISEK